MAPEVHQQRFLTAAETKRLIKAIDQDDNRVAAQTIKLLLLTGARRNEITQAKWEHVDWQRRTLLVPVSKSGKPRTIALNGAAIALLQSVPRVPGSEHIFPCRSAATRSPRCSTLGTASGVVQVWPRSG